MGIAAGPNVSKDGLVLYYDIANSKSFRGEPTTNLVLDPDPLGSWAVGNYLTSAATLTYETESGIPHMKISSITYDSGYPRIAYTNLSSTVSIFSLSFEAKGTPGSKLEISFYSTGVITGTKITVTATMTNNWQRFEFPNNYHVDFVSGYPYLRPITTGSTLYIRRIQVESKSYTTAYVNGTRGTTVATGGGVIDLTGNSNSGQLVNGPTYSSSFGGVVSFDGTNDYIDITPSSIGNFGTSSFVVTCWGKPATGSSGNRGIMSKYNPHSAAGTGWFLFFTDGSAWARITQDLTDPKESSQIFANFATDSWHHIAIRRNEKSFSLFVDGSLVQTNTTTNIIDCSSSAALRIGSGYNSGYIYQGDFSLAQIYNKSLTDSQIKDIYNATRVKFQNRQSIVTNGLVLHLDASNRDSYKGSGTTWTDLSGYGNTGTLTNGPVYKTGNGGHIQFDGVNDYVNFGDVTTTEFGTGDFTLSSWIFIPADVVENVNFFKGIIIKKGANAANAGYGMYYNTGQKKFLWSTADGTSAQERFSSNTWDILKGQWSNVVMIRQSGATNNGHFYINGVLESISSSATVVNVNNDYNLTIGASSTLFSNYFFQGNIANALIYNRALSATEVLQNYNATKSRFGL